MTLFSGGLGDGDGYSFFLVKNNVGSTAPGRGRAPSQSPGALVGHGAARGIGILPSLSRFFGRIFLLIPGAGLGAWVGVTGRSRCRARFAILAGLSLVLFCA